MLKLDFEIILTCGNMKSHMRNLLVPIICSVFLLINYSEAFCGQPFYKPIFSTEDRARNRISNGIEARRHSHPWIALLIIKEANLFAQCGGSLIHWKHENASALILTAAHCVIDRLRCREREAAWEKVNNSSFERPEGCPLADAGSVTAYLGMHDLGRLTSVMKKLHATAIRAAKFDNTKRTDDIALIKLEKEVTYSVATQGICLPAENEDLPPPEIPCLVAGWGRLRDGSNAHKLQQFQTYIIDGEIRNPYFRKDLMICTGHRKKHTGVRKGDSGGPLVCLRNNTFVVYGVVSFAFRESCTDKQAFTKLTQYLPWLNTAISQLNG